MEKALFILILLACPVGMLAMGAIAWFSSKVLRRGRERPQASALAPTEGS